MKNACAEYHIDTNSQTHQEYKLTVTQISQKQHHFNPPMKIVGLVYIMRVLVNLLLSLVQLNKLKSDK